LAFAAGASLVVAAIAVTLILWAERESVEHIRTHVSQVAPWLVLWRIGLFAILIVYWRELADWITKTFALDPQSRADLVRWRWRATSGLMLMDLVLVEDLIGRIRHALI
jgi:hypothetical protein